MTTAGDTGSPRDTRVPQPGGSPGAAPPGADEAQAADPPQDVEGPRGEAYEFGVLFVHGIGDQQRGHTLGTWAGALTRWLRGWIGGEEASGREVELCRVTIDRVRPVPSEEGPDSAALRVRLGQDDDAESCEWLLAESWWAQEVTPPPVRKLGAWLVRVAPFLIIAQIWPHVNGTFWGMRNGEGPQERIESGFAFALSLVLLTLVPPLTLVLVLLVWLTLLLLRLPLPGWQDRISRFVGLLAASLGDSYLLIEEPLQYDRMRDTVLSDLETLAQQCERVAVVSHSQGAALSHDVLRQLGHAAAEGSGDAAATASKVRLFASVGSGIWKLNRLRDLSYGLQLGPTMAPIWGLGLFSAGAAAMLVGSVAGGTLLVLGGALSAVAGAMFSRNRLHEAMESFTETPEKSQAAFGLPAGEFADGFRWVDFWGSHDPVPNGPLVPADHSDGASTPSTREVHNLASFIRDHTAYAGNFDQFWSQLVAELWRAEALDDAPLGRWRPDAEAVLTPLSASAWPTRFWQRRQLRVRLRALARSMAVLLGALALVTFPAWRTSVGERLLQACENASAAPASVADACAGRGGDTAWYLDVLVSAQRSPAVVGGLVLLAGVLALYVVTRSMWRAWQRAADERAIHGKTTSESVPRGATFIGALLVQLVLAMVFVGGVPASGTRAAGMVGVVLVAAAFAFRCHDAWMLWTDRPESAAAAGSTPPDVIAGPAS